MGIKKTLVRQILVRLAFLVLPLLAIYLLMEFTYNPHALCTANEHRHTMGPVGYIVLAAAVVVIWFLAIIFEQIWRYFKKDRKISFFVVLLFALMVVCFFCFFL
ncbi:dolichyl-phosphate-mannose--protein O-mannosyl transferase [Flavobacterium sp. W4I14]|nr:dolichyl-phosphate-mannose--protein O-mannosyl transferase [Flavobacterium sp. W4I14]